MCDPHDEAARNLSEPAVVPRRATLDDRPAVARIHRLAFFAAMPQMPVLHTPEEDLAFYSTTVFPVGSQIDEVDGLEDILEYKVSSNDAA
jgi:hypothetical protein